MKVSSQLKNEVPRNATKFDRVTTGGRSVAIFIFKTVTSRLPFNGRLIANAILDTDGTIVALFF